MAKVSYFLVTHDFTHVNINIFDAVDGDLVAEEAVLRGMSVERFWLWGEVMRRVAQMSEEDNGWYHYVLQ
jgi:hypothetical protein